VSGSLDPGPEDTHRYHITNRGLLKDIRKLLESQKLMLSDVVMMHVYLAGDPAKDG
jgi:enamine deaminase RidA (YjgF/YER057c/UK114 family)